MADPLGFYKRQGLRVQLNKTAGWALIRDKMLNKEHDASHFLSPMPIAISQGLGSVAQPMRVATIQNINGQAITLHVKHKDKRDPKDWKGFKFAVPFEYSMHNFLLRYYVAEHGLDPDKDIQIRVVPPPEMVANLRAGNIDGFLGPGPVQPARRVRGSRIHPHPVEGDLGRPSVLRLRLQRDADQGSAEHLCGPVPLGARGSGHGPRSAQPGTDREGDRADAVPEPAGKRDCAGADGQVRRRPGRSEERTGPRRLRSGALVLDGGLDAHADEALGLRQGRRELPADRRAGLPADRRQEAHEGDGDAGPVRRWLQEVHGDEEGVRPGQGRMPT